MNYIELVQPAQGAQGVQGAQVGARALSFELPSVELSDWTSDGVLIVDYIIDGRLLGGYCLHFYHNITYKQLNINY